MNPILQGFAALGLAALSGILLAFSLRPFDQGWVAWIALAPLLAAAPKQRPLHAIGLGLVAGITCGAVHRYIEVPFLLLAVLLAGVTLLAGRARQRWDGGAWAGYVAAAALSLEWLTTFAPIPLNLALTQYRAEPLLWITAYTGIWGVSALVWLVNAAFADAFLKRSFRSPVLAGSLGAVLLAALVGMLPARATETLRVAAVQDCVAAEVGHLAGNLAVDLPAADPHAMTRRAAEDGARLVVWSEMSLGTGFDPAEPAEMGDLARETGAHLVVGYLEPAFPKGRNLAALIDPAGKVVGSHQKIHLFLGERRSTQPGREARALETRLGRLGVEICFDSCFTGVTRSLALQGARLIALPNFDPPVTGGMLHYLHSAILPFRAAENGVAFVRSDSNGLSQIVAPDGRIVAEGPLFAPALLVADVPVGTGRGTFFSHTGDWLAYAALLAVLAAALTSPRRRRRSAGTGGNPARAGAVTHERLPTNGPEAAPEPSDLP
ncbi:MAG: nitrilase-related carbon-nitrogen hydrolase [Armatimonadota bacterium]